MSHRVTPNHVKVVCRECGITIRQCRCPAPSKVTRLGTCNNCEVRILTYEEDQVIGDSIVLGEE